MRISSQSVVDSSSRNVPQDTFVDKMKKNNEIETEQEEKQIELSKFNRDKLSQAVDSLNEFLQISYKSSKFVLHEELDCYYIQLVDQETDEVIKEIPPKKLLDAFYEMQKLVGMIVDEKI